MCFLERLWSTSTKWEDHKDWTINEWKIRQCPKENFKRSSESPENSSMAHCKQIVKKWEKSKKLPHSTPHFSLTPMTFMNCSLCSFALLWVLHLFLFVPWKSHSCTEHELICLLMVQWNLLQKPLFLCLTLPYSYCSYCQIWLIFFPQTTRLMQRRPCTVRLPWLSIHLQLPGYSSFFLLIFFITIKIAYTTF